MLSGILLWVSLLPFCLIGIFKTPFTNPEKTGQMLDTSPRFGKQKKPWNRCPTRLEKNFSKMNFLSIFEGHVTAVPGSTLFFLGIESVLSGI